MELKPSSCLPVAVVGGGVTGLAAAYTLQRLGKRVRLFETSTRLGGAVQTEFTDDGWCVETGPTSLLLSDPQVRGLLDELGLADKIVPASPAAKNRYVVRGGRAVPLPTSPGALLTTPLFSWRARFRLVRELMTRPRRRSTDLSLAKMMEAHFGQELVDYAVQPFTSGVYAGDATKLSAKYAFPSLWAHEQSHGSIVRGQMAAARARRVRGEGRPGIVSFARGLQTIPDALAATLPPETVETRAHVEAAIYDGAWKLVWRRDGSATTEEFSSVVLALPGHALAKLTLNSLGERPFASLDAVETPPVAAMVMGYRRDRVAHPLDGFGLLAPACERRGILGAIFSSTVFPGRTPAGCVSFTVMLGGALQPEMALLSPAKARALAEAELSTLLGVDGPALFFRHRLWARAIPQYQLGHERTLETIERAENAYPRLFVGGQIRDGISLSSCLASGLRLGRESSDF